MNDIEFKFEVNDVISNTDSPALIGVIIEVENKVHPGYKVHWLTGLKNIASQSKAYIELCFKKKNNNYTKFWTKLNEVKDV